MNEQIAVEWRCGMGTPIKEVQICAYVAPGPFQVVEGDSTTLYIDDAFGIDGGRNYYLAEVRHGDPDELKANAAIFTASRDLFDACKLAEKLLDSVAFVAKGGDTARPLRALRAAIAKATGSTA